MPSYPTRNFRSPAALLRVAAALAMLPPVAAAQALNDHDNGPLTGIFGFPNSTEGANLASKGRGGWSAAAVTSSHSIVKLTEDEWLKLDGETTRLSVTYSRGITERLELGLELPYVFHESGNLDSIVSGWHELFGLPTGARDLLANDLIDFEYSDRSGAEVDLYRSSNGIGDIRLLGGWRLFGSERSSTALRFSVKFASGDSASLHGSGGTDFSIGIAGDHDALWGLQRLNGFYRLSGTHLGEPEFLRERYRAFVARASGGLGYRLTESMELRAQAALRGSVYDSEINALGTNAVMLSFGANFRLSESYRLALGVAEDVNVSTMPDVTFVVTLDYAGN